MLLKGFTQLSDLCQAGFRREVLVVDLPQQPPLVVLVHLSGAVEQQGPSAALHAPLNLRFLTARTRTLDPHLCGKTAQLASCKTEPAVGGANRGEDAHGTAWFEQDRRSRIHYCSMVKAAAP